MANVANSSLALVNATITNNQTGAGNSVGGNGGGVFDNGSNPSGLLNTIVSGNTVAMGGQGLDLYGGFNSRDHNLIGDTNGATIINVGPGDILNQNPPGLALLANNGGPTQTHGAARG